MAKKTRVTAMLAPLKRGLRKKRTSSIGWVQCSSQAMKAASSTTPAVKPVSTAGSPQPWAGASITP